MKLDLKTAIMIGTLLFTMSGFYYTTISDLNVLSLNIQALKSENRMQQQRLDNMEKKISKMRKQIKELKKKP